MAQWSAQTQKIIGAHDSEIYVGTYESVIKKAGGFDKWVESLGGVFAKCHTLDTPVETVADFRERCEYVQGLMSLFHFCYWNGQTWYFWLNNSAKAFYKTRRTSSCPSGTIRQLCTGESGRTRITNCNYGIDTLSRALGRKIWSRDYRVMEKNGAKRVTKAADLKPGDLVHFFRGSVSYNAWRHVAIVHSVDKDGTVWLADFGSRYIKTGKPLHAFPSEYTTYGAYWVGLHWLDLEEDVPMLNGIDIASYQAGINLQAVPADFVIVKATEGTGYVNPQCNTQYSGAKAAGRLLGLYHYANGGDPVKEADFFLQNIANYVGSAILVLDWERGSNAAFGRTDVSWCRKWLDRVYEKTGVRALVYMSQSVTTAHDWSSVAKDYGLWLAQYVVESRNGYKQDYAHGITGAWKYPAIWQYTSGGYLSGWNGRLDLNVAYMDKAAWAKYAGKQEEVIPVPRTIKIGSTGKLVRMLQEFLGGLKVDGKFGAKTKAAVIKWQKAHKLTQDGVVGPKTWRAILESLK